MILPGMATDGMGGKRYEVRTDSEEKDAVIPVPDKYLPETVKISPNRFVEQIPAVGRKAESTGTPAADAPVDTGITYPHACMGRFHSIRFFLKYRLLVFLYQRIRQGLRGGNLLRVKGIIRMLLILIEGRYSGMVKKRHDDPLTFYERI